MMIRTMTLTALAVLVCGCGPDTPDQQRSATQDEQMQQADDQQMAASDTAAGQEAPATEAVAANRSGKIQGAGENYDELLGKMVVNSSNGSLLGNTEGVAQERSGQKTYAIVAVSNDAGMKRKEVVVPVEKLSNDVVPEKLRLAMTREQLIAQPEANSDDYTEVARWKFDPGATDSATATGQPSTISEPTSGQPAPTGQ